VTTSGRNHYVIITPYWKEDKQLLQRCIRSVKLQSVCTDHLLVADGHPQRWIDGEKVRHLKLDRAHGDNGNTPRGLGALMAIGEEYEGIGFLDADNWLESNHVKSCIDAAHACEGGAANCDYVIARRWIRRVDGTLMPIPEEAGHVDTSCFFFFRGSFHVIPFWATMPRNVSSICDRVFNAMLKKHAFQFAQVAKPTVNFHCLCPDTYRAIGEEPPPEATHYVDGGKIDAWLASMGTRELEILKRLAGVDCLREREWHYLMPSG
jgi:hypothetical protein